MPYYLIDDPADLAPLSEWLAHRERLKEFPQGNEEVKEAIARADRRIEQIRSAARNGEG